MGPAQSRSTSASRILPASDWFEELGVEDLDPACARAAGGPNDGIRTKHAGDAERIDCTIDGVHLPAGAEVTLDGDDRLETAALPSGITVTLDGSTWRGFIKFGHAQERDSSAPARISVGEPVIDMAFDGVLCRAGQPVAFWGSGGVHSCTLAKDTPAQDNIADAERGTVTMRFVCEG
jgi:hypothetical protein